MMVLAVENRNLLSDEFFIESMSDECVYEFFAMMDKFGSIVAYMDKSDELWYDNTMSTSPMYITMYEWEVIYGKVEIISFII